MLRQFITHNKPRASLYLTPTHLIIVPSRASSTSSTTSTPSPPESSSSSTTTTASSSSSSSTSNPNTLPNTPPFLPNNALTHATVGSPLTSSQISTYLSQPSWSVQSLLDPPPATTSPSSTSPSPEDRKTPTQLHHLLRLSALPLPSSAEEEAAMLSTLEAQLRFVRAVQRVDTTGVQPLVAIRDERTGGGPRPIGLEDLKGVLEGEVQVGRYKRIVKKKGKEGRGRGEGKGAKEGDGEGDDGRPREIEWDPLKRAPAKVGRFIKVNTEKN